MTDETVFAWAWTLFGNGTIWQRRLTFTKDDPFVFEVSISPDSFTSIPVALYAHPDERIAQLAPALIKARDFIDDSAFNVPNNDRFHSVTKEIDAAIAMLPRSGPIACTGCGAPLYDYGPCVDALCPSLSPPPPKQ